MWAVLGASVAAPVLAICVMTVFRVAAADRFDPQLIAQDVGFDLCVMGIGLAGGLGALPEVQALFGGAADAAVMGVLLVLAEIMFGGIIVVVRKFAGVADTKVKAACILGFMSVALPSVLIILSWPTGTTK